MSQQREQVRADSQPVGAFSLTALRDTPRYTYLVAAVAALGGMLFGYDIGVISGAENLLKASFRLSSGTQELAVAAVLIGAVIGGLIGGRLADKFSRRRTLIAMALLYGRAPSSPRSRSAWSPSWCSESSPASPPAPPRWSSRPTSRRCPRPGSAAAWSCCSSSRSPPGS
jgi:MFS family permease